MISRIRSATPGASPGPGGEAGELAAQRLEMPDRHPVGGVAGVAELGVGVEERAAPVSGVADLAADRADHGYQLVGGMVTGLLDRLADDRLPFPAAAPEVGHDQLVFAGEVGVEEVLAAAAFVDDLLQADRVYAVPVQDARRHVQDPVSCSGCGLSCHR